MWNWSDKFKDVEWGLQKREKNCTIISYSKIPKIRDSIKLISLDVQKLENTYLSLLHKNIYFDACAIVRAINFCFDTWPIVLLCFDMTLMSLLERCVFKASVLTPCNSSSKIRHCYFLAASKTTQDHYTHWIQRDGVVVVEGCKNNISIISPGTHQGVKIPIVKHFQALIYESLVRHYYCAIWTLVLKGKES